MSDEFESFDSEDDILEGFDDGAEGLSDDERDKRSAAFQLEVKKNAKILMKSKQYDAKQRLEAARWLGESGELEAIQYLVTVYKRDRTEGMKETAAYALGQFKALEEALGDPEMEAEALQNIENIVLHGKFGGQGGSGPGRMVQIGLGVSFVVILLLALLMGAAGGEPEPVATIVVGTPTPDLPEVQIELLQEYHQQLISDASALQEQFGNISRGQEKNCAIELNQPEMFSLSPVGQEDPTFVEIETGLNTANTEITEMREQFNRACANPTVAMPREDALGFGGAIVETQRNLSNISTLFALATGEVTATVAPEVTEEPTLAPTPTLALDMDVLRPHILTLSGYIDDMISIRGATTTIAQYWTDVQDFGSSGGCIQPDPTLPNSYDLPIHIGAAVPELQTASDNVNLGIQMTSQALAAFRAGCDSDTLTEQLERQLPNIELAQQAFQEAQTLLAEIRQ